MKTVMLLAALCVSAFCGAQAMDMNTTGTMDHTGTAATATATSDGAMHDWTVNDDRAFLSAMIAHHEGAIDISRPLLGSRDRHIREWADDIIEDQEEEVLKMRRILQRIGGEDREAADQMRTHMEQMMQMSSQGDPDTAFIIQMIPHHAAAIDMSLPPLVMSKNPDIRKLAEDIIEQQAEEIREFRDWMDRNNIDFTTATR